MTIRDPSCSILSGELYPCEDNKKDRVVERIRVIPKTSFQRRWGEYAGRGDLLLGIGDDLCQIQVPQRGKALVFFDGYLGRRSTFSVRCQILWILVIAQSQPASSGLGREGGRNQRRFFTLGLTISWIRPAQMVAGLAQGMAELDGNRSGLALVGGAYNKRALNDLPCKSWLWWNQIWPRKA